MAQLTKDWQALPVATRSWEEASKARLPYTRPPPTPQFQSLRLQYYEIMYLHHVKATSVCILSQMPYGTNTYSQYIYENQKI